MLVAALLTAPLWVAAVSGAVQVRACVPAGSPLLGAEIWLLRPAPTCPSGQALGDAAFAVVGTVCLVTVAFGALALAALAGCGSLMVRLAELLAPLVDAVTPGRRSPGSSTVSAAVHTRPTRVATAAVFGRLVGQLLDGAVVRRGPPVPA